MRVNALLKAALITSSVIFTGCSSVSTMQTAKVLDPGDVEMTFAAGSYLHSDTIKYPLFEWQGRIGVAKNLDAGLKFTTGGSAIIDAKYNLVDTGKFAVAIGLGYGKLKLEAESGGVTSDLEITDTVIPLYISYNFTESFAVYFAPKRIDRESSYPSGLVTDETYTGGSVGVKLGTDTGLYLEVSRFEEDTSGLELKQTTIAFFVRN